MTRLFLTGFGAVVAAAVAWVLTAFAAYTLFARSGGAGREGANAMGAIFYIGPAGALLTFAVAAAYLWRVTADPQRHTTIGISAAVALVALLILLRIAFAPTVVVDSYLPSDLRAEAQFEVRIARTRLPKGDAARFQFDLRRGEGTLTVNWTPNRTRTEGEFAVLPCAFSLNDRQTGWIFAVMLGEAQLGSESVDLVREPLETTSWTDWKPMEGDLEYRFRTAILPKRRKP
jgi:hypothetical protein